MLKGDGFVDTQQITFTPPEGRHFVVKYYGNSALKAELYTMTDKLVSGEVLPIEKINIRIIRGELALGLTWIMGKRHRILINKVAQRMIATRRGSERIYCVLAHEIGHLIHYFNLPETPEGQPDLEFRVNAEVYADQYALRLLAKVFPDPEGILLEQIENARETSVNYRFVTTEQVELAQLYADSRNRAISVVK